MTTRIPEDLILDNATVLSGDCVERLRELPDGCVQMCVTSPPYFGLRDYGVEGQVGHEPTPAEYVEALVNVFREVHRVLAGDGTLWLNLGDSYAANRSSQPAPTNTRNKMGHVSKAKVSDGLKPKDLIGIPWRVAFALQADGWYLRQDIIWHKPNPMPESVRDRCTKSHEYIFLFSKQPKYYYDAEAVMEEAVSTDRRPSALKRSRAFGYSTKDKAIKGYKDKPGEVGREDIAPETRNRRSVWTVNTRPYKGAHFATFPTALIEPCVLAGSRVGDIVLDPFSGSGTTGQVCIETGRQYLGIELNQEYIELSRQRIQAAIRTQGGPKETSHAPTNNSMLSPTYVEGL